MLKELLCIAFIAMLMCSSSSTSIAQLTNTKTLEINVNSTLDGNSHLIEDVPYVSQETDFYCTYACPTMILNYYGCNTSLHEVLFSSGVGYSLVYSHPFVKRFLLSCVGTSNWEKDRRFTGDLFGLTYHEDRLMDIELDESHRWDIYWNKIKENISSDRPVITIVDPSCLSSVQSAIQDILGIPDVLWDLIPETVFTLFPSTMTHMITIVGFNEENESICYNDPSSALFGDSSYGTYAWMDISDIRKSMLRISSFSAFAYMVGSFYKSKDNSSFLDDRLIYAHNRNLQKMSGDPFSYDDQILRSWDTSSLGINGLRSMYDDLGPGLDNRPTTIFLYKILSTLLLYSFSYKIYRFFDIFLPSVLNLSDFNEQMNYVHQLSIEKHDISDWLFSVNQKVNNETIADICHNDAVLLGQEARLYERLAENFSIFLQKGLLLPFFKAVAIIENMQYLVSEMIDIEENILKGL